MAIERLMREALALDEEAREVLLEALQQSFEPDDGEILDQPAWDAAWATEIRRRLDDLAAGRTRTYSHDEVMTRVRSRLRGA